MQNKHETKPALDKEQGKGTERANQIKTIFQYLETHIATASMVSKATGVPQKNICRYKRDLEKAGALAEIKREDCKLTGFKAWYLTTNEKLFPQRQQLKLF
jgi:hypothetical protein